MKMEEMAEVKELVRVVQEYAAIKRERDELLEKKEELERELQKRENIEPYLDEVIKERDTLRVLLRRIGHVDIRIRTIDKGDLEKALKQFYKYEAVTELLPTVSSYGMNGLYRRIPIERLEFCCKYLKAAALDVDNEDIVLAFKGFKAGLDGDTWFTECPYCGAKLVINDNGMKTEGMGEC